MKHYWLPLVLILAFFGLILAPGAAPDYDFAEGMWWGVSLTALVALIPATTIWSAWSRAGVDHRKRRAVAVWGWITAIPVSMALLIMSRTLAPSPDQPGEDIDFLLAVVLLCLLLVSACCLLGVLWVGRRGPTKESASQ